MPLSSFNSTIADLSGSSTFYDWFNKENEEIIAKLNLAKVSGICGGDGVLALFNSSSGLVTLSIGGTSGIISAGLTFTGPLSFLGETIVPNVSYKIPGLTSGNTGYTFGSVIRVTTAGYTAAIANSAENAEVVGVLSSRNSSYSVVTVLGKIEGDFTEVNSGSTLSPGCVYFLSGQTAGYITTNEPSTIGYVSKPVIVGLGATSGVVVQYRGNYLNANTTIGESGSNRIFVTLPISPTDPRNYGFSAGNFISYAENVFSGNTFMHSYLEDTGRTRIDGWFLSGSFKNAIKLYNSDPSNLIYEKYLNRLPYEENFIVGMIENVSTSGGYVIYQVITKGTTTVIPKSLTTGSAKGMWAISGLTYEIAPSGITQQLRLQPTRRDQSPNYSTNYQVGIAFQDTPTYWYVDPKPLVTEASTSFTNSSGGDRSYASNYAFNGDYEIWQRTTARSSAYTTSGNIYFADAWIRRQSNTGTSVQSIERKNFAIESTDVEGSPSYYVDIKCLSDSSGASPSSGEYSVGHIVENINSFNGETITVSFYAKCAAAILGTQEANVYFARYSAGSLVEKKTIGIVNITNTTWQKFTLNYIVPNLAAGTYSDDYVEIGIDIIPTIINAYNSSTSTSSNIVFSIASLSIYKGSHSSPSHIFDNYNEKLKKCQRFYFSTYTESQTPGTVTMLSNSEPALNTYSFSYTPQLPYSIFKLPVLMRTTPTVILYSPNTGSSNEVFNYTAGRDLRYLNGTKGYNNQTRYSPLNVSTVSTSKDETSIKINLIHGIVPYDVINCHIIADSSYSI